MTQEALTNERTYRQWFDDVWNRGELELLNDLFHPDFVLHSPASPEPIRGIAGYKSFVETIRSAFPDVIVTIDDVLPAGETVVGRMTMRMTHTGPYFGIPPTNARVTATQMIWARFEDGRVREAWQEVDALGMLAQLGVIPPPGLGPLGLVRWMGGTIIRFARLGFRNRGRSNVEAPAADGTT